MSCESNPNKCSIKSWHGIWKETWNIHFTVFEQGLGCTSQEENLLTRQERGG